MKEINKTEGPHKLSIIAGAQIVPGEEQWVGKALSDKIKACTIFTPKTKQHIVVVASKCTGCGLCYKYCLGGVFDMDAATGKAVVTRLETCMECAICAHICPSDAIGFDYPSGGTGVELRYA
jgi:NAD-dependent dihydropyrimidine dehydrogenase PreA subunit